MIQHLVQGTRVRPFWLLAGIMGSPGTWVPGMGIVQCADRCPDSRSRVRGSLLGMACRHGYSVGRQGLTEPISRRCHGQSRGSVSSGAVSVEHRDTASGGPSSARQRKQDTASGGPSSARQRKQDTASGGPSSARQRKQDTASGGPSSARQRIGILGGTFDPIHSGHMELAKAARDELQLDRVLLVVANDPWQKTGARPIAPASQRYALVAEAARGIQGIEPSAIEIERGGLSYTADTVAELRRRYHGATFYLVIGADVARALSTWERVDEIRQAVSLAVASRTPGGGGARHDARLTRGEDLCESLRAEGWTVEQLRAQIPDISSSAVRERLQTGGSAAGLVPDAVVHLIRLAEMYAGT